MRKLIFLLLFFSSIETFAASFQDTFVETSDTNLSVHNPTPTDWGGWSDVVDTCTAELEVRGVDDNVRITGGIVCREIMSADTTPGLATADYDVEITVAALPPDDSVRDSYQLCGRIADSSNMICMNITDGNNGGNDVELWKRVGGTNTLVCPNTGCTGSDPTANAAGNKFKLELRGSTWKVYRDTGGGYTEIYSHTCSSNCPASTGKAGIGVGNNFVSTDKTTAFFRVDDFLITEQAAATETDQFIN